MSPSETEEGTEAQRTDSRPPCRSGASLVTLKQLVSGAWCGPNACEALRTAAEGGQKEVENPEKGDRALKTKGTEDKVSFLLCVGEGLSSGFTKISEARGLWTPHLPYRKKGWLCV